ncbi:MAG: OmpA family protein [Deltaproteobacteria bacterium]|nr:MAG: OmpA family protein [Deltaproteobacteria bacterium]
MSGACRASSKTASTAGCWSPRGPVAGRPTPTRCASASPVRRFRWSRRGWGSSRSCSADRRRHPGRVRRDERATSASRVAVAGPVACRHRVPPQPLSGRTMYPLMLLVGAAMAQSSPAVTTAPDVDAQIFRPTIDGRRTLLVDDATVARRLRPSARLLFQYVNDPLVYVQDGEQTRIVSDIVQGDLLLGVGYDRLRIGLDVPVVMQVSGVAGDESGLGDIGADIGLSLLDPERDVFGLAVKGRVDLPTGDFANAIGTRELAYEVGGVLDLRLADSLVAVNFGTRGLPTADLVNVTIDDQFYLRAGLAQALADDDGAGLSLEAAAAFTYGEPLDNTPAVPVEGLVGGWVRVGDFVLRGGGGMGITDGVGAPDARVLLGIGYEPPDVADRDRDGILDDVDRCPTDPEDIDRYRDDDGCPDPATMVRVRFVDEDGQPIDHVRMAVESPDGTVAELSPEDPHPLHPGTYELHATAEGFVPLESSLVVPEGAEHEVTKVLTRPDGVLQIKVVGPDGRPVDARLTLDGGDRGTTGGEAQKVRIAPGEHTIRATANGYRVAEVTIALKAGTTEVVELVLEPAKVVVTVERVELREKVLFDFNQATIKPESYPLLDEVVAVMKEHPEIEVLRIEGHTDERGSAAYNLELSEKRAEAVRQYLIDHGIAPERLRAVGYGESKPLNPGHDEEAWEQNRRVEMWIEKRAD